MDIRQITPDYAVAGQVAREDFAALAEAGFTDVICNRPDTEVGPEEQAETLRGAAEAAGLTFHVNPVIGGALSEDNIDAQRDMLEKARGPVFAYCRSGNRSTVVWALARAGTRPSGELVQAAAEAGYDIEGLRPYLESKDR
ncbi:TIGR01244 family sulfur transferase [Profundibacterium mesophilum]|uniref:Cysteine desulfurase n=1 Tax=Profundibacterium mesophilum KAUST100406-0324 TaxID=1037889 RepID=A0A921TCK9_9RHOB|nr:protein tyrosine phosphatase family protein [Profundibacterium mesophilum]KAF0675012.1 cysteine desulfurase [Profundibacterium mesophilum KAUST100406-0324]